MPVIVAYFKRKNMVTFLTNSIELIDWQVFAMWLNKSMASICRFSYSLWGIAFSSRHIVTAKSANFSFTNLISTGTISAHWRNYYFDWGLNWHTLKFKFLLVFFGETKHNSILYTPEGGGYRQAKDTIGSQHDGWLQRYYLHHLTSSPN